MKTNSLKLLLGISAIAALTFTASAFEQLKGAQVLIGQAAPAVQSADAVPAAPAVAMSCPKCSDKLTFTSTTAGKGAFLKVSSARTHTCSGCGTQLVALGANKARTLGTVHSCSLDVNNGLCCAAK
jgi:hypothetical protein